MDPPPEVSAGWRTLGDVADWLELPPVGDTPDVRGELWAHLGASDDMHWRNVAGIPVEDLRTMLAAWRPDG